MSGEWFDELLDQSDPSFGDDSIGAFYCPYTNGPECALLTNGWQPQELCRDLECDQLRLFQPGERKRRKAA